MAGAWKFLADSAVESAAQDRFGVHSAYAEVLSDVASTCETPFSVALYGGWGTGKTSICNILSEILKQNPSIYYVYLDVWKYSSDPLKRWILFETERQLIGQTALKDYKFLGRSLRSHLEFEESWDDKSRVTVNLPAFKWLTAAVVVAVGTFLAFLFFAPDSGPWRVVTGLLSFLAAGSGLVLLFQSVAKELFKALASLVFERRVKHVSAKPAFSSEKFGEIFHDMVHCAASDTKRVVFVFDNLDRCPEEVAVEAIGVIKTYLDERGCVYVIPCDEEALKKHISKSYIAHDGLRESDAYAKEFLDKFFQVTLRLPIAPNFDIESYLDSELLKAGMGDLPPDARDVFVLGYPGHTPRQIKRVLNDLIGYRSLADRAEKDGLLEAGAVTADLALLTKMSVISNEWPAFVDVLASDPELWSDLMDKILADQQLGQKKLPEGLETFLRATRHVSPSTDIRPFIYLKRVSYERNVALTKAVQESLRKGDSEGFAKLLTASSSPAEREEIVRVATELARRWLEAAREVFVKNSVPVLLRAAHVMPSDRLLEITVSDLLNHVDRGKPLAVAEVVPLEDLFGFAPSIDAGPKERCIGRFIEVFDPSIQHAKVHVQCWKQFLLHQDQLSNFARESLRDYVATRYTAGDEYSLQIAYEACRQQEDEAWIVGQILLSSICGKVELSGTEVDQQRIEVVIKCRERLDDGMQGTLGAKLVAALHGTRTRVVDNQVRAAVEALSGLGALSLGAKWLEEVVGVLVEQVTAHGPLLEKATWLSPLIPLYAGLSDASKNQVDGLYRQHLVDPVDPNGLVQFLLNLTPGGRSWILSLPENIGALHEEPGRLEARFSVGQAPTHRAAILKALPAASLLEHPGVFDETRPWDLILFPGVVLQAREDKVDADTVRRRFLAFLEQRVAPRVVANAAVIDRLVVLGREAPELLDESNARALAQCCLSLVDADAAKYLVEVRFLATKLPAKDRLEVASQLVDRVLKPRHPSWVRLLQGMVDDLATDGELANDRGLVVALNDYAFEAARVSPTEAVPIVSKLLPHIPADLRDRNLDEALDRLLNLESNESTVVQMEPYFELLRAGRSFLEGEIAEKLAKFLVRMLGSAKRDEDVIAILRLIRESNLLDLSEEVRDRVSGLAEAEGPLSEEARLAIQGKGAETGDSPV